MLPYVFTVGTATPSYSEAFDTVTAPALPGGWTTSTLSGTANLWITQAVLPDTAPNRAFAGDPITASDNVLVSPIIALPAGTTRLQFRHAYDLEGGFDGGVLEIATGGGAFQDIVVAGGTLEVGDYTTTLATGSTLAGRRAWSGSATGYSTVRVLLPAAAAGQNIQLRWRVATDTSVGGQGWSVDSIVIFTYSCTVGPPPGAFGKSSPANGTANVVPGPTLSWAASTNAASYFYCVDTSANNVCNASWVDVGTATSVTLAGLAPATAYSWQVAAVNGTGTTIADGGTSWTFTTQALANPLADLAIDFGPAFGLWTFSDGGGSSPIWQPIHGFSPTVLRAGDLDGNGLADLVVNFAGYGVWSFTNGTTWTQLHPFDATEIKTGDVDGNGADDVVVVFPGFGLWVRYSSGAWANIHPTSPTSIAVGNIDGSAGGRADVLVSFMGAGVWSFRNNSSWGQVHPFEALNLQIGDLDGNGVGDLIVQFGGLGEWALYNSTSWAQLHGLAASAIVVGNIDGDAGGKADMVINFPTLGVWAFLNNSSWTQLHGFDAAALAVGDLDANGQSDVLISFPGLGLWSLTNLTTWTQIHGLTPEAFVAGRMTAN